MEAKTQMSYMDDFPTQFNWTKRVRQRVRAVQRKHPWQTYANTYRDHPPPPYINGVPKWPHHFYERVSVDFWGGGGDSAETYTGYRGKPLPKALGDKIWNELFYAEKGPQIAWILWQGQGWYRSSWSFGPTPDGPPDSDPGHYNHLHCTFVRGT